MAAGLYLSFHGLGRISARVTGSLKSFWSMADYIANTVRPSPLPLPFGSHCVRCFDTAAIHQSAPTLTDKTN